MSFSSFRLTTQPFLHHDGLPFADLLPEETVQQIAHDAGLPPRVDADGEDADGGVVYTAPVTLWAFLSQVLFRGEHRSCAAAVAGMDGETYEQIPESMEVREVHVQVHQPGFRVEELVVVTSLTDADAYPRADIAELYHRRWLVELDIRALKINLGMDLLRCKTPELVEKEIWTCLLAYNLIRQSMLQAALLHDLSPRQLSFTAALQKIAASWGTLLMCDEERTHTLIDTHLKHMAKQLVGDRPDRVEPRAIKRRPKPHKLLTKPRAQARTELLNGASVA